jgi:hypothetical protein
MKRHILETKLVNRKPLDRDGFPNFQTYSRIYTLVGKKIGKYEIQFEFKRILVSYVANFGLIYGTSCPIWNVVSLRFELC